MAHAMHHTTLSSAVRMTRVDLTEHLALNVHCTKHLHARATQSEPRLLRVEIHLRH